MKKIKIYFLLLLFMAVSGLFLMKDSVSVEAANADFYKKYSGEIYKLNYEEHNFRLNYKCRLKMTVKISEQSEFDTLNVYLWHDDEEVENQEVFIDENVSGKSRVYEKTITLPADEYSIYVSRESGYREDYEYDERRCWYSIVLTGEYIPELSSKSITLEEGKTKTLSVKGTKKSVKWTSSNKTVASVNNKGVVNAKKAGKATITATCGQYSFKCNVTVKKKPVTYSQIAKKMKMFAKKNKNFTYKTVDVGNECRLYAGWIGGVDDSRINTEGHVASVMIRPYLQLVKKKNKPELRLRIEGRMSISSISYIGLYCSSIQIGTSNGRMSFSMKQTNGRNTYDYSNHIYKGVMQGYATISTSSKINATKLRKLKTMLGQKSVYVRVVSRDGSSYQGGLYTKTRNEWKKLIKEYNTLLKEFK